MEIERGKKDWKIFKKDNGLGLIQLDRKTCKDNQLKLWC